MMATTVNNVIQPTLAASEEWGQLLEGDVSKTNLFASLEHMLTSLRQANTATVDVVHLHSEADVFGEKELAASPFSLRRVAGCTGGWVVCVSIGAFASTSCSVDAVRAPFGAVTHSSQGARS